MRPHIHQAFERRQWPHAHALRQFERALAPEVLAKLEERGLDLDRLWCVDACSPASRNAKHLGLQNPRQPLHGCSI